MPRRAPPPPLPNELHAPSGRPELFYVQKDWLYGHGNTDGDKITDALERWHRAPEEWELSRPVLLRGAYRTEAEANFELSWRIHYAGQRHRQDTWRREMRQTAEIIAGALVVLGVDHRRQSGTSMAMLHSRAVQHLEELEPRFRTSLQIAAHLAQYMMEPNTPHLMAAAARERDDIMRHEAEYRFGSYDRRPILRNPLRSVTDPRAW